MGKNELSKPRMTFKKVSLEVIFVNDSKKVLLEVIFVNDFQKGVIGEKGIIRSNLCSLLMQFRMQLIFSLELEISGVAVQSIQQNSKKW